MISPASRLGLMVAVLALAASTALAQGHGGGKGPGGGGPKGPASESPMPQVGAGRAPSRATEHDRQRMRSAIRSTELTRERARAMREAALGEGFGAQQARQRRYQIQREFQALEQRQQAFERGLAPAERQQVQDRLREMDQIRDRAREQLRLMDEECAKEAPDRERLQTQAHEVVREMDRLQLQYQELGIE